jgi:hypothetical protein
MEKTNILIPDGHYMHSYNVATCLHQDPHCNVYVYSTKEDIRFKYSRLLSGYNTDTHAYLSHEWAQHINHLIEHWEIDILFPVNPDTYDWIDINRHLISDSVKIPLHPTQNSRLDVDNKYTMSQLQTKMGLPTLKTYRLDTITPETELNFPALVKPVLGISGLNIMHYLTHHDLLADLHRYPDPENWIVQPFVTGCVYGGSFLAKNGQILTSTTFKESHIRPRNSYSASNVLLYRDIPELTQQFNVIASTLKWNGVMQCDYIYLEDRDEFVLLDANPRYWRNVGTCLHINVNYPSLHYREALGEPLPPNIPTPTVTSNNLNHVRDTFPFLKRHISGLLKPTPYQSNLTSLVSDPIRYVARYIRLK